MTERKSSTDQRTGFRMGKTTVIETITNNEKMAKNSWLMIFNFADTLETTSLAEYEKEGVEERDLKT